MLLKPIRAAHGTACDPRAIADGEPRLRTDSHGHTETAGMNELGKVFALVRALGTDL